MCDFVVRIRKPSLCSIVVASYLLTHLMFIFAQSAPDRVRVNDLAGLESLVNIFASRIEVLGILIGIGFFLRLAKPQAKSARVRLAKVAATFLFGSLLLPAAFNFTIHMARDLGLFY